MAFKRRFLFPALLALLGVLLLSFVYSLSVFLRAPSLYELVKPAHPGLATNVARSIGTAFTFDPELGPVLTPNANGVFLIPKGEPIPFHHDDQGLRAPLGVRHSFQRERHPRLLFLGDSFTYGQLVRARDSFAFRAARMLGGEAINAGVPGYGLAQMVLQARRLIPKYQPDYVIVQYSPWLVSRAQTEFATDSSGMTMAPYYADAGSSVIVRPVPFLPPLALLSRVEQFRTTPVGFLDKLSFTFRIAFPFFIHRDANMAAFRLKEWLGFEPGPSSHGSEIISAAYSEMDAIARKNGARMVILALGSSGPLQVPGELFPAGVAGVNGWRALVEKINPETSEEYVREYFQWRGNPPVPVDSHPNERAHAIIAEVVAQRIRMLQDERR